MSKKVETGYTSKMSNKAAHDKRKAARRAIHLADGFDRLARKLANRDVCYVNVCGIAAPVCRMWEWHQLKSETNPVNLNGGIYYEHESF